MIRRLLLKSNVLFWTGKLSMILFLLWFMATFMVHWLNNASTGTNLSKENLTSPVKAKCSTFSFKKILMKPLITSLPSPKIKLYYKVSFKRIISIKPNTLLLLIRILLPLKLPFIFLYGNSPDSMDSTV